MRASGKGGEATSFRRRGDEGLKSDFSTSTTPAAPFKGSCRDIFLMSRPPRLS